MTKRFSAFVALSALLSALGPLTAQAGLSPEEAPYAIALEAELGFVDVVGHTYQSGDPGTNFDYVNQGGQDILFPALRLAAEITLKDRHIINFLYQPLEVNTNVSFDEAVVIDGVTFPADTPMALRYSFPFWRLTYLYDFSSRENLELAAGGALQLRNASVTFRSLNDQAGQDITVSQNLGPVPALAFRGRYTFPSGVYLGAEATGLYASSAIINGADFEFEGSILDASAQAGVLLNGGREMYVKLRFLGGTAVGNSEYVDRTWTEAESTYTSNKLATLFLTLGLRLR